MARLVLRHGHDWIRTEVGTGKRAVVAGVWLPIAFRLQTPVLVLGTDRATQEGSPRRMRKEKLWRSTIKAARKPQQNTYGVLKTGSRHLERISVWDSPHSREKAKNRQNTYKICT